jgi:hypothetical protein
MLVVLGPGVSEGQTRDQLVLNNDLAPTFADLAGAKTPSFVDGRSLVPLLGDRLPPEKDWRKRFVVESVAERGGSAEPPFIDESMIAPLLTGDPLPNDWRRSSADEARASEEWGRPWMKALRTEDYLYVEYKTGTRALRPQEGPLRAAQRVRGCPGRPQTETAGAARHAREVLR